MSNWVSFDLISVPEEWSIIPCGVFFKQKSIKNTEGEMNLSVYRDYGVIPKDSRDDNHNRVSEDTSNYKLVEPGDFVLNKMKGWSGSLGVSEYRGIVSPSYTVLEPVREIHNKYFHYLLRSETYRQMYESLSYGVRIGQWELHYHDFKQIPSLYPPIDEQELISRYLDKKTEQVDSLIEKIQKKIELLKEKRTSLINQCVTKGLDPNVEMKDSGVEWIGEIPKHWKFIKFNILCENISNGTTALQVDFSSFPVSRIETISGGIINPQKVGYVENLDNKLDQYLLNDDDILFSHINSFEVVGQSAIYREALHGPLFHGMNLLRIVPKREVCLPDYLHKFLQSSFARHFIRTVSKHAIGQVSISISNLSELRVPIPTLSEQHEINKYLETEIYETNQLIDKENQRIKLFTEYRQSLISSVVTGKVRVSEDMV